MFDRSFEAFGTQFTLLIDAAPPAGGFPQTLFDEIKQLTEVFDQRYSRFISESEVSSFRYKSAGEYEVSVQLAQMLQAAQALKQLTSGRFDPAVTFILENLGYDSSYSFTRHDKDVQVPTWSIVNDRVTISDPLVFDIGGIGKGFWIDQISQFLTKHGFPYHLVDGGGDMMATQKSDGSGWQIALEWPGKPDLAIGTLELKNQGLAVSDVFRRHWQDNHHIVDAKAQESVQEMVGSIAVATNCFTADQLTSALFFTPKEKHRVISEVFQGEFLNTYRDNTFEISSKWPGELF